MEEPKGHPRLTMLQYLYSRSTMSQAMGEVMRDYIEATKDTDAAPLENLVATVRREMKSHPKVGHGTT